MKINYLIQYRIERIPINQYRHFNERSRMLMAAGSLRRARKIQRLFASTALAEREAELFKYQDAVCATPLHVHRHNQSCKALIRSMVIPSVESQEGANHFLPCRTVM
jgi:hypothetical protein